VALSEEAFEVPEFGGLGDLGGPVLGFPYAATTFRYSILPVVFGRGTWSAKAASPSKTYTASEKTS
jgi:hypothetical protein